MGVSGFIYRFNRQQEEELPCSFFLYVTIPAGLLKAAHRQSIGAVIWLLPARSYSPQFLALLLAH